MTDEDPTIIIPGDGSAKVGPMTAGDVTALISLINGMLQAMEARIITRLDQNSSGAIERWGLHEKEHGLQEGRMDRLESVLADHLQKSSQVWKRVQEEELREEARIAPVKNVFSWLWANWRTILLLIIGILAVLGFSGETLNKILYGR